MTAIPPVSQPSTVTPPPPVTPRVFDATRGRSLASAITVFLGGYLLLSAFTDGQLSRVAWNIFAGAVGSPSPDYSSDLAALAVLKTVFAVAVVVVGLLIGRGPVVGRTVGSIIVVVGSIATFVVLGLRLINGGLPFPGGRDGIPFQMVFTNPWFATVLFVGVAWLLTRSARAGWLAILGVVALIPVPLWIQFAGLPAGTSTLLLLGLSAIVGAGIILAGRPLRD